MIVKCQRSLSTTEDYRQMLFYNCTREWQGKFDLTPEWDRLFGPTETFDSNKFYAEVRWRDRTQPPLFVRKVEEQSW